MVFDFGGGTLDITLFHVVEKDDYRIKLQVISEGGEAYHGETILMEATLRSVTNLLKIKRGKQKKAWL